VVKSVKPETRGSRVRSAHHRPLRRWARWKPPPRSRNRRGLRGANLERLPSKGRPADRGPKVTAAIVGRSPERNQPGCRALRAPLPGASHGHGPRSGRGGRNVEYLLSLGDRARRYPRIHALARGYGRCRRARWKSPALIIARTRSHAVGQRISPQGRASRTTMRIPCSPVSETRSSPARHTPTSTIFGPFSSEGRRSLCQPARTA